MPVQWSPSSWARSPPGFFRPFRSALLRLVSSTALSAKPHWRSLFPSGCKRLGQIHAESVALLLARPMFWLASIASPYVGFLAASTQLILRAIGVQEQAGSTVTQEDINQMLAEGSDAGVG